MAFERSGSFLSRIEQVLAPVRVPELPGLPEKEAEEDAPTDDGAELADDTSPDAPGPSAPSPAAAPVPARGAGGDVAGALSAEGVREIFSHIQVRPASGGKVTFEATSEAATALAALLEGVARMFSAASTPT